MLFPLARKVAASLIAFLLGITIAGCGGSGQSIGEEVNTPEWYNSEPQTTDSYILASNSARSRRMQVAVDKATTRARGDLASTLEVQMQGMTEDFTEEINGEMRSQFVSTRRSVTNQVLSGTQVERKEIFQRENGEYHAFVLMEMPIGKASQEFLSQIQDDEEMYTRFRKSQAFERMQEAIEEYEKRQENERQQMQSSEDGNGEGSQRDRR